LRTGGKEEAPLDGISSTISDALNSLADELRARANATLVGRVRPLPPIEGMEGNFEFTGELEEGVVYELAFDGSDSDAEVLEKMTGLTLLGDCDESFDEPRPCAITGKSTQRRQYVARMY
jgi:hypothetical protein